MSMTTDKNTPEISGRRRQFKIKDNAVIYGGAIVVINHLGDAFPGKAGVGLVCVGIAEERGDTSKGDKTVTTKTGIFGLMKKSSEKITNADIGTRVYIVDDQTVSLSGSNRSPAGYIFDVSGDIVWVKIS